MSLNPKISALLFSLLFIATLYLYVNPLGPLPPAGSFFHPKSGFWGNAETTALQGEINLTSEHLSDNVDVFYDERGVPHIFAQNEYDLYFTQGYVTARDRLFQMELQIRAAGGYLAEWLGDDLIEYDKNQRRLGMVYGAERAMEEISSDPIVSNAVNAYADGVNTYIQSLSYDRYPIEYKILNVKPAEWKPINTALLLKYMTQMLAARSEDVQTSNTMAHLGEDFVNDFLSKRPELMDPIVPEETEWNFEPKTVPQPEVLHQPSYAEQIELWQPHPFNGSNNWVVDGSKTEGGYPILSNDMHLNMSMPSIWYEVQLHTPSQNVYGVSLQGTPTVIVGFNEHIAWGSTNTGADVMDWYEITFRDDDRTHYLHDGEWLPTEERIEEIRSKSGSVVQDTILFTHHGPVYESREETPVSNTIQRDHALTWIGHEPSNELLTFYKLNRGEGYQDFREAFETYKAPAQNMNYAGTDGNIAIQTGGKFPLKWEFQGRTVSDGSDSQYDWSVYIPYEHNPYALNPERGYLSAANQYPTSEDYPYYLGESFAPFERGRRINDRLSEMENITVQDFSDLLMDSYSYHAERVLPAMLSALDVNRLDEADLNLSNELNEWDYQNLGDLIAPTIFREWWKELYRSIWSSKFRTEIPMRRPDRDVTVDLIINNPESPWFDDPDTENIEIFSDHVNPAFEKALNNLREQFGVVESEWKWGFYNNTNLNHLGQIPGLGIYNIYTDGSNESVNAIWGSHGPSWRMVVELDPNGVRGYGVYPGGQSGNPGSKDYDLFVDPWIEGELFELNFMREKPSEMSSIPLILRLTAN
ncbi:penicillin acylase family protein [Rhodohalobacter halophilus]|uniref:penicillin acylase family protein n=1 Tax=Rhodohalobacter halophilus TaxID=1812810 RepID=UPI00083FD1C2|nr:penicillin acylase family protein [Rhodohalobacter halophilus]